ncbi:hemagglutinin repeat-containing protein [Pseudomonas sp. RIT-PI-S]|uniref:hemagglutinin repeat-containing protein n=1 Tax=Pseudomonas sp. RIT-PI-S TaxID=3035295 RepID=UPI0021D87B94|nr:hemagglutinin repeat-containing protein [Pseudomonas sp. RIT-PI-S]
MKKSKGSPSFYLQPDPLRWSIAAALLIQPMLALGNGIAPIAGPGGTALVGEQQGVPVIAIVAPNASGLSHNHFSDYNVPVQGLVLNNALAPGASQLAGQLGANPQLNGQAATSILNEVVGQLPSNIRGTQEIFGQAADYVLANPNGIHIQGVGFVNTPRAVFLVGTPEIQDGRLTGLNTFEAPGDLRISGQGLTTAAAVDLIAPRIDSQGNVQAGPQLTAIAGRNRVNADSLELMETRQAPGQAAGIDLNVLGAMRAGRIRMVSTREGAGIRLAGPEAIGRNGVSVSSAGDLAISRGDGNGLARVAAALGEVSLNANRDLNISGGRLAGRALRAHAGRDLTLDATSHEKLQQRREAWDKKAWFITTETFARETKETHTRPQGNILTADRDAELSAGRHLRLRATDIHADQALRLQGGEEVTIDAGVERTTLTRETHHRKHLWRGDKNEHSAEEKAVPSKLSAGNIDITAGGKAVIRGSDMTSRGDLAVHAQSINIDSQALERNATHDEYRGDLTSGFFWGNTGDREETGTRQRGSDLHTDGTLTLVSDDVRISGSNVFGQKGTRTVGEKEAVIIESVSQVTHVKERRSNTQVGGIFGTRQTSSHASEQPVGAVLGSAGDLIALSAKDIRIEGSKVAAGGKAVLEAKGNLNILPAKRTLAEQSAQRTGSLVASAGETRQAEDGKAGSKQWQASVGYQRQNETAARTTAALEKSLVTGAAVSLTAGDTVAVHASEVKASQGDLGIVADQLEVISGLNETRTHTDNATSGGGLQITGGMDRVGSAFTGSHERNTVQAEQAKAATATLAAEGDINLGVSERIAYKGALVEAKGNVNETSENIRREELVEVDDKQEHKSGWKGELGASIEWKELLRPIEKAINGQEQTRFQQQGVEDALAPPSLGADGMVTHINREQGLRTEQPHVTQVRGTQVTTQVEGLLYDRGTKYSSESTLAITVGEHQGLAAAEKRIETLGRVDAEGGLRVDTLTGHDVNARLNGSGGSVHTLAQTDVAVPMTVHAKGGVAVQLGTDGRYEGTQWNSGDGALAIKAGGDVRMVQAENRQHTEETRTDGYGLAKGGTGPSGKNALLMGGLTHKTLTITDTQGLGGSIQTSKGQLDVEGNALLQGVAINNGTKATERFDVNAGGTAHLTAMVDSHEASGQHLGGALQLGASRNPAADAKQVGGALGGHIDIGRVSEHSESRRADNLKVKELSVSSLAHDALAVRLEGTQLAGDALRIDAPNGGVAIEAARTREEKDNLTIAAGAGVNGSRGLNKADDASAVYARAKVNVDNIDSTTYQNADVRLKTLEVNAAMDLRLHGATVAANKVGGSVGRDLILSSAQDQVYSTQVNADARLGKEANPQGLLNGLSAVTGPLAGKAKEKIGKPVQALDANWTPTLLLDVVREQREQVAQATSLSGREGIDLDVAGDTRLTGAKLRSGQGKVALGSSEVQLADLNGRDYRADVSINATTGPADLLSNVISEFTASRSEQAKADEHGNLGVIRTGGHDKQQTVSAAVEQRR